MDRGVGDAQERGTAPDTLASFLIAVRDGLAIQSALDPTRVRTANSSCHPGPPR
jgi:hypothetical protein